MSIFDSIFGSQDQGNNVDKNIVSLFSRPAGPLEKPQQNEVGDTEKKEGEDSDEIGQQEEDGGNDREESSSEELKGEEEREEIKALPKKRKREENNEDEQLEQNYFKKRMGYASEDNKGDAEKPGTKSKLIGKNGGKNEPKGENKGATVTNVKENELEQAERTVFVGNVPLKVIDSKSSYKAFKKLFSQFGKVKSIRFRSIAFAAPLPRKVALARKSFHHSRDSLNAYVVFTEKGPSLKCVPVLNASVFDDHHLRVDHLAHPAPKDYNRTIFIGNLDFEEKEETLWKYFSHHTDNDVEAVRIVRDSKTNLGKGFALVQFRDSLSVNKCLLLNNKPFVENGRAVRISKASKRSKPSLLSPNHVTNKKPQKGQPLLYDSQKTKLGKAKAILGKADRATAGRPVEGKRAVKGAKIPGIKGLKSSRKK